MNCIEQLHHSLNLYLTSTFSLDQNTLNLISFELNTDEQKKQFGHAHWNAALVLAKYLKQNPRSLAQKIVDDCNTLPFIKRVEFAGAGFINFFFNDAFFTTLSHELITQETSFFKPSSLKTHNYSLEFVSANPTGPLHIGHGRGGIIGDVLARTLRFMGHRVTTEFYINDAGSQITKLGISLKIRCMQALGHSVELPEDAYHGEYLQDLAQICIKEFGDKILTQSDSFFAEFAKIRLLALIKETLATYHVSFDVWFSEKTLHDNGSIKRIINQLEQKELVYLQEGARWFKASQFGDDKDRVIQKANGEYTYLAADVAYLENKLDRNFDKIIMILGQDHHSYAVRMKALMQALHNRANDLDIILYQLVSLQEENIPVRMSKRTGTMISLQDVIEAVGTDVARFFYLNRKADAHLDFDVAKALKKTDENPVYYIQYAYVRAHSILKKAAEDPLVYPAALDPNLITDVDRFLLLKISSLSSLLVTIASTYQTHLLAYYTYSLAQAFHHFYRFQRVIVPDDISTTRHRLALVKIIQNTLKTCLDILGVQALTAM